jgi:ABC-2 type transport system ATP-binding protein
MADEVVIRVQDLVKEYNGHRAVNGVSFEVFRGEVFGLLGENGAGKTTTLEIIEGLRKPTSGSTSILGMDSQREVVKIKELIGVQLQASAYFAELALYEILDLFGSFYPKRKDPLELLALVGLEGKAKSRVDQLSGGQKQRFSLVASLVNDPEIVFLDEPTTGLDPIARRNLWSIIRDIQGSGKTVVLTSHYLEEAESLCSRVGIMREGDLLAIDHPAKLTTMLKNPIRVDFLPGRGMMEEERQRLYSLGELLPSQNRSGEFTLYLKDQENLRKALRELEGMELVRMTVSTGNLEDVFISLTGETITEEES